MIHSQEVSPSTLNPTTGQPIRTYDWDGSDVLEQKLARALAGFEKWRKTTLLERARHLASLETLLLDSRNSLAHSMAVEMGKPLAQGIAEVEKCAKLCRFISETGPSWLQNEPRSWAGTRRAVISHHPLGPILGIMPWNFPLWQVFRFALPTLMAGNTVLIKHADCTLGTALLIQNILDQVGLTPGVYQTLVISHIQAASVIADPRLKGVSLTGSERAGREVASLAGRSLKKTVLELGGSDPYLILDDADLDLAARVCSEARFLNAGQTCIAAKRFLVMKSVYSDFRERLLALAQSKVVGDPLISTTEVGPLARRDLRDGLHQQVVASVSQGARCLLGGSVPTGAGFFYPVTVLENVRPGQPAFDDELFGPVACLIETSDLEEAVTLANQTRFGLGAAVFSRDIEKAYGLLHDRLNMGIGAVNLPVQSTPELPFGGIGSSGYGRELGREGMLEFTNTKTLLLG